MKGLGDMEFYTDTTRAGKFVGKVVEFPDLKTGAKASRLDAIDEIITLTAERIGDIHESMRGTA
jgi:hypothetical protein